MAEWPPKVPNYPVKPPPTKDSDSKNASSSAALPPDPAWPNIFSEFSRVKRAAHRSSATETASSMDSPRFAGLDDDYLSAMFSENQGRVLPSNVMPELSEHNSNTICEADKKELDDANSGEYKVETEMQTDTDGTQNETPSPSEITSSVDSEGAPATDPKRVKRWVRLNACHRYPTGAIMEYSKPLVSNWRSIYRTGYCSSRRKDVLYNVCPGGRYPYRRKRKINNLYSYRALCKRF
jgi:hypothetical protein